MTYGGFIVTGATHQDSAHSTDSVYPLSTMQQRIWFLEQFRPGTALYNICVPIRLDGWLDLKILGRALYELVLRHEPLRLRFTMRGEEPVQIASARPDWHMEITDLSQLPADTRSAAAMDIVKAQASTPFLIDRDPLFRARTVRLEHNSHILALTTHHLVSDGWSHTILFRELTELYDAFSAGKPSPLPALALRYRDVVRAQATSAEDSELAQEIATGERISASRAPFWNSPWTDRGR